MKFFVSSICTFLTAIVSIYQVINKFYKIRQNSLEEFVDTSWDEKCQCLLHDPLEMWSFNDSSTSRYIVSFHLAIGLFPVYDIIYSSPKII